MTTRSRGQDEREHKQSIITEDITEVFNREKEQGFSASFRPHAEEEGPLPVADFTARLMARQLAAQREDQERRLAELEALPKGLSDAELKPFNLNQEKLQDEIKALRARLRSN